MEKMSDLRVDNLRKGAEPVNKDDIIDMIKQTVLKTLAVVNPLTNRGKRLQLIKILCLTVIPILGVWGFTMYSLSDSLRGQSDIEVAKISMSIVVVLGRLIHRLQRERDMSVLYLSDLGPGTKTFLLAEYIATDNALERLNVWPGELTRNPREEFRSKLNLMRYISQHRNSVNPATVDLYEEMNFYSSITKEFLEWLVENIKGSGFGSTWKTLVAYQKITRCKEDVGVERAYGAMFYATGHFPKWTDYEYYNEKIHDFKYNYKTAGFYSAIVVPLHNKQVSTLEFKGLNFIDYIYAYRYEIQYNDPRKDYTSDEKAKFFFDNMTEYLDSLLKIQEEVAQRISIEVDGLLHHLVLKVGIYAVLVVIVIGMCPIIMFSSEALASDIQRYTQTLVHMTTELNVEKHKTDMLLYQMVPESIAKRLKSNSSSNAESEYFRSATVMFSDIPDFKDIFNEICPADLVQLLNNLYHATDERVKKYDVYKVETINDCTMFTSGVPNRNEDKHVSEITTLALDLLHMMQHLINPSSLLRPVQLRIGIHTGACMAAIVGPIMLRYCLFGETVDMASRLKSHSMSNKIHIAEKTYLELKKTGKFKVMLRGTVDIKRQGKMKTFWVLDKNEFDSGSVPDMNACDDGQDIARDVDKRGSFQSSISQSISNFWSHKPKLRDSHKLH